MKKEHRRPTIAELQAILDKDEDMELVIMPNGEVRAKKPKGKKGELKPITMRESLGGEYGNEALC